LKKYLVRRTMDRGTEMIEYKIMKIMKRGKEEEKGKRRR
jgi:hypothetical protein